MAYVVRSKDNPGDVGRAADQQQSVDNETALYAAALGQGPVATGGTVRQFVKVTGMADNVATTVFTVTTTNEAGATDGGVWAFVFEGIVCHGIGPTGETSVNNSRVLASRAMNAGGTGVSSAPVVNSSGPAFSASSAATKGLGVLAVTAVEVSEYVIDIRFQLDLNGTTVTTGEVYGMVELHYAGFTTPPVVTSAG